MNCKNVASIRIPHSSERVNKEQIHQDLGTDIVQKVHRLWNVDDEWCTWEPRGFSWWGHHHRQRVWSEPGRDDDGFVIYRVCAETDIAHGVNSTAQTNAALANINRYAPLDALILVPERERVVLHTSIYAHEETAKWLANLLSQSAILQPGRAEELAHILREALGAEADTSPHPDSGWREESDEMLGVTSVLYIPHGEGDSAWSESDEFEEVAAFLNAGNCFASGGRDGLTAEFPFGSERTGMLRAFSNQRHPGLGSGLLLQLHLPLNDSSADAVELAGHLNQLERRGGVMAHALGSWTTDPGSGSYPVYVTFVPTLLYTRGLLQNLAIAMWRRSLDVASLLSESDQDCSVIEVLSQRLGLIDSSLRP